MEIRYAALGLGAALLATLAYSQNIRGTGPLTKQTRKVASFHGIQSGGAMEVIVKKGSTPGVTLEAQKNLLSNVITRVESGELIIETRGSMNTNLPMRAYITMPKLTSVDISGASTLKSDVAGSGDFHVSASGASQIHLPIAASKVHLSQSGASQVTLKGSTSLLNAEVSGASQLHGRDLKSQNAKLEVSGGSMAEVNASKSLSIDASGGSNVSYFGHPSSVNKDVSGGASVSEG